MNGTGRKYPSPPVRAASACTTSNGLDAELRVSDPISDTKRACGFCTPDRCSATCSSVRPQLTPTVTGWPSMSRPLRKAAAALPTARRAIAACAADWVATWAGQVAHRRGHEAEVQAVAARDGVLGGEVADRLMVDADADQPAVPRFCSVPGQWRRSAYAELGTITHRHLGLNPASQPPPRPARGWCGTRWPGAPGRGSRRRYRTRPAGCRAGRSSPAATGCRPRPPPAGPPPA